MITSDTLYKALLNKSSISHVHQFLNIIKSLPSTDLNNITELGIYYLGDLNSINAQNRPGSLNDGGYSIVLNAGYVFQIFLGAYQNKIYYRSNGQGWQSWTQL